MCHTHRYTYNRLSQLLSSIDPLGNTTKYTFDSRGNVLSQTDAEGYTITYNYDAKGNPKTIQEGDGDITTFVCDNFGNRTLEIDALGNRTEWTYDTNDNRKTETTTLTDFLTGETRTLATTWDYDDNGNITLIAVPKPFIPIRLPKPSTTTPVKLSPTTKPDARTPSQMH